MMNQIEGLNDNKHKLPKTILIYKKKQKKGYKIMTHPNIFKLFNINPTYILKDKNRIDYVIAFINITNEIKQFGNYKISKHINSNMSYFDENYFILELQ